MAVRGAPGALGAVIRQQRELAALPMRQLAAMVGISGPYLSQIERGLRTPSEQVLQAIAASLQVSAEALGGPPPTAPPEASGVLEALAADPLLDDEQRAALRVVYLGLVRSGRSGD